MGTSRKAGPLLKSPGTRRGVQGGKKKLLFTGDANRRGATPQWCSAHNPRATRGLSSRCT